jgi:hypothetical protein
MARALIRRSVAAPVALLLTLVLAGQASAASWSAPFPLTDAVISRNGDIAGLGGPNAVATYTEDDGSENADNLYTRRTTNSGQSWSTPLLISTDGSSPAIAGLGQMVDLVFNSPKGRVRYTRSTDGGQTFGASVALSPKGRFAWRPAVARGPDGLVAVVYEDVLNGNIAVRVSHNGGMTFDAADILADNGNENGVAAAIGDGVIYVAYGIDGSRLKLRRSTNEGATWKPAQTIANGLWDDGISITAAGQQAYIAFTLDNEFPEFSRVWYRRTTDNGAGWAQARPMAPADWTTYDPDLAIENGAVHAVFGRCITDIDYCYYELAYYTGSTNGMTWPVRNRITPESLYGAYSPKVAFAGKILAMYVGDSAEHTRPYVRRGTP